ncbi:Uncharacterized protein GBIM_18490 [Gryllus bimaculatus]|nr:Uncharacterized protein GBIM_18490 [Gryllus bimaculatus]
MRLTRVGCKCAPARVTQHLSCARREEPGAAAADSKAAHDLAPAGTTHSVGYGHHLHPFYFQGGTDEARRYSCALQGEWKPIVHDSGGYSSGHSSYGPSGDPSLHQHAHQPHQPHVHVHVQHGRGAAVDGAAGAWKPHVGGGGLAGRDLPAAAAPAAAAAAPRAPPPPLPSPRGASQGQGSAAKLRGHAPPPPPRPRPPTAHKAKFRAKPFLGKPFGYPPYLENDSDYFVARLQLAK